MTVFTKTLVSILFIGMTVECAYYKDYEDAFLLALVIIVIVAVWYHERFKLLNK